MNNTIQTNQSFKKFKEILTPSCIILISDSATATSASALYLDCYLLINKLGTPNKHGALNKLGAANCCKLNCFFHAQLLLINKPWIQYVIGSCKLKLLLAWHLLINKSGASEMFVGQHIWSIQIHNNCKLNGNSHPMLIEHWQLAICLLHWLKPCQRCFCYNNNKKCYLFIIVNIYRNSTNTMFEG